MEGAEQVGTAVKAPRDYLVREVTVTDPGYAYIFLSNENLKQVDIHFDDVTITHIHSNIVAGADYYPYGLAMNDREITGEPYRWGYQGQFGEKDTTTGWNQFELRFYDAKIARWLSADPAKQYYSPYKAMGNNPTNVVDPNGGFGLGGTLPEVVFSYTRLSTVAAQVGLSLGRSLMSAGFANAFCPDCPDPLTGNFEVGDQYIFDSEGPHQGAVYELTDLTKGKDGWMRLDGELQTIEVSSTETLSGSLKSFGAKVANPFVDVGSTIWSSTRNGFNQYFNGTDYENDWYSYKIDQDGFYRNVDQYGFNANYGSQERSIELITNTVSANMTIVNSGIKFPISNKPWLNFLGNQAIKQPAKAGVVKAVESALSVH